MLPWVLNVLTKSGWGREARHKHLPLCSLGMNLRLRQFGWAGEAADQLANSSPQPFLRRRGLLCRTGQTHSYKTKCYKRHHCAILVLAFAVYIYPFSAWPDFTGTLGQVFFSQDLSVHLVGFGITVQYVRLNELTCHYVQVLSAHSFLYCRTFRGI